MSVFTISSCLMRQCEENDMTYYREVMYMFIHKDCEHKVAIDKKGNVLRIYKNLPDKNGIIKTWITLMSGKPSRFEQIPVDLENVVDEEEKFIKLCRETKESQKMIVYSISNMKCEYKLTTIGKRNYIEVEGTTIELLDRDAAVKELEKRDQIQNNNFINSIIAGKNVRRSNNSKILFSRLFGRRIN